MRNHVVASFCALCAIMSIPILKGNAQSSRPQDASLQTAWDRTEKYFIVVAVNHYTTSSADLPFATVDAAEIAAIFEAAGYQPIGSTGILQNDAATRDNFIGLLTQVQNKTENSHVVIYYSGHAVADSAGRNLWLQMLGQKTLGPHYGISVSEIVDAVRESYPGQLALIIDSCFSGQGVLASSLTLRDLGLTTSIFTSSSSVQESQKIAVDQREMSAFTYALTQAAGKDWDNADQDKDGVLTFTELERYTRAMLRKWATEGKIRDRMTPFLLENAQMVFSYNDTKATNTNSNERDLIDSEEVAVALSTADKLIRIGKDGLAFQYPTPAPLARQIASTIRAKADPYTLALRAIAEGRSNESTSLLERASRGHVSAQKIARARAWAALYSLKYEEAAHWYEQALALSDVPHRPLMLETANALSLAGNTSDAEFLYGQVIKLSAKDIQPLVPAAKNNLATLYAARGDWDKANPIYEQLLGSVKKNDIEVDSPLDVATISDNLAYVYRMQGKSDDADRLELEAAAVRSEEGSDIFAHLAPGRKAEAIGEIPSGTTSITGCLLPGDSIHRFELAENDGSRTWELRGNQTSLAQHVGHNVQITGIVSSRDDIQPTAGYDGRDHRKIDVTGIHLLSGICPK